MTWPTPITNPPGQSEISYRAGDFTSFRRALLAALDGEQELTGWSPKEGDLGLQVLEWWAYLGDILTFYNERIANNSYLRTAAGPQAPPQNNVAGLAALLGYLPRPAITAQGLLAAKRRPGTPNEPLVLPRGLQIVSTPTATTPAQTFQTGQRASFTGLSDAVIGLPPIDDLFQPAADTPGARSVLLAGRAAVQAGDSLVLVKQGWDGTTPGWAMVTVVSATAETKPDGPVNTRVILDSDDWAGITEPDPQASDYQLLKATATALLWTMPAPPGQTLRPATPDGQTTEVPLATLVRGVAPGDIVLFTGLPAAPAQLLAQVTGYAEGVAAVQPQAASGPAARPPARPATTTTSPAAFMPRTTLEVRAPDVGRLTAGGAGGIVMRYGLREAGTLIPTPATTLSRRLGLTVTVPAELGLPPDGTVALQDATGAGVLATASRPSPQTVQLSAMDGDSAAGQPPLQAPISLLADLVQVSGGTSVQPAEVLGDGDAAAAGQAFTLQHSPLVYLPGDPPASTLTVTVNGVAWTEVPSFYQARPDDTVYQVRGLADGSTQVVFGDGTNGARLPTGTGNVTASYRYGPVGPPPPPGCLSTVLQPQPNLATVVNPVSLTPGTDPEPAGQTAQQAPSGVVLLGQAVISPGDCEQIAATFAGVTRVRAYWTWDQVRRCPGLTLYVDGEDTAAAVLAQLPLATSRVPITVSQAQPVGLAVTCQLAVGPGTSQEAARDAATSALSDPYTGVFSPGHMTIGQRLYRSQVEAALSVSGVTAVLSLQISRTAPGPDSPPTADRDGLDPGQAASSACKSIPSARWPMTAPADDYDVYYQARLWESLPALYRDLDTVTFADINAGVLTELDADGPAATAPCAS